MVRKLVGLGRNVRDRVVSPVSLTVILAVLAGLCLWQGLRPDPVAVRGNVASESSQTTPSTPKYRTQEIRDITLGTWVLADNPELPGDVEGDYGEYDAGTWRTIALRMTKDDGAQLSIQLARPSWWIEETHAAVGATIFLDMEEMGAVGDVEVLSIGPCSEITPRPSSGHRVVTGKFVHSSGDFLNLYVDGLDEPIGTTSNHPFWSEDRQEFVRADELTTGEHLRLADGALTQVATVTKRDGIEPAFNLEVDGEHVYFVGATGVLVHNSYERSVLRNSELAGGHGLARHLGKSKGYLKRRLITENGAIGEIRSTFRNRDEMHYAVKKLLGQHQGQIKRLVNDRGIAAGTRLHPAGGFPIRLDKRIGIGLQRTGKNSFREIDGFDSITAFLYKSDASPDGFIIHTIFPGGL